MTAFSNALENEILSRYLKNTTAITPVATVYAALFTGTTTDASQTEVPNSNNYSRQAISWGTVSAGSVSGPTTTLTFPQASGSWGTITGFGIYDSGTHGSGNLLFWGNLSSSVAIGTNDRFEFAASAVTVSVD